MMSGIRGKDTNPERLVRSMLHSAGFRFRLHVRDLPGKPDIVLPKYRAVILVHGCFWHRHDCPAFRMPATRTSFWRKKLNGNQLRDERNRAALISRGWRVMTVWECSMRGKGSISDLQLIGRISRWLDSPRAKQREIAGRQTRSRSSSTKSDKESNRSRTSSL